MPMINNRKEDKFMKLNVLPINYTGLDCFEDVLISVANYFGREYKLVFCNYYDFEYLNSDNNILTNLGDRFTKNKDKISIILKKYCNIQCNYHADITPKQAIKLIKYQIDIKIPVIISLNVYWSPWNIEYQRSRREHVCLVVGINKDNSLICIDPILGNEEYTLKYNDFSKGFEGYGQICVGEKPIENNYKTILNLSYEKLINNDICKNLNIFIDDFNSRFDFDNEFINMQHNILDVKIFTSLKRISGGRYLYLQFLKYINCVENINTDELNENLDYIHCKWNTVLSLLCKGYFAKQYSKTHAKVVELLIEISRYETKFVDNIRKAYDNPKYMQCNKLSAVSLPFRNNVPLCDSNRHIFLDLQKLNNNIAFGNREVRESSANLTGTGLYFIFDDVPSGTIISNNNMLFRFPIIKKDTFDNTMCDGQLIDVPIREYSAISIMATAEWGNYIDYIKMIYDNKEIDDIQVNFSDWAIKQPLYDECVIWRGKVYNRDKKDIYPYKHNIFSIYRNISHRGLLKQIKLPYCLNIHIFAITLYYFE